MRGTERVWVEEISSEWAQGDIVTTAHAVGGQEISPVWVGKISESVGILTGEI